MTFTEILSLRKMNFSHYKMTLNWGISRNDWNDKLIDGDRGRIASHLLCYGCVATSLEICAKSCCVRKISKEDLKQKQWEARGIKNVPCFLWHLWETALASLSTFNHCDIERGVGSLYQVPFKFRFWKTGHPGSEQLMKSTVQEVIFT